MCYFNCVKRKKCEKIIEKTWFIIDTFVYVSISNINIEKVEDVNIIEKNFDSIIDRFTLLLTRVLESMANIKNDAYFIIQININCNKKIML